MEPGLLDQDKENGREASEAQPYRRSPRLLAIVLFVQADILLKAVDPEKERGSEPEEAPAVDKESEERAMVKAVDQEKEHGSEPKEAVDKESEERAIYSSGARAHSPYPIDMESLKPFWSSLPPLQEPGDNPDTDSANPGADGTPDEPHDKPAAADAAFDVHKTQACYLCCVMFCSMISRG